ncbi:TrbI/VirB10 family protein [Acidithiobacillus sp.]|uniref:TrbI/VirB10 family protein n=1 Tax=Acidithiobacillus sp. TaxID=1872118 RepID=UPI003D08A1B3
MGFLDKLKMKQDAPAPEDAPSGPPPVAGSLKSSGASAATVLRKKYIAAAVAILVVGVGGASYYVYDFSMSGSDTATSTITPTVAPDMAVPKQVNIPVPVTSPVTSPVKSGATANTGSAAPIAVTEAAPPPAQGPSQPPQPTPQQLAFESAMAGGGQGADVSWDQTGAKGASSNPAMPPAAVQQTATLPKAKSSVYSTHLVRKEVSPYELLQGTVIPATLETGIKSDLPGEITAVVNQPVYSSVSGAYVLVPAGSKLVGTYDSKVIAGATRVGVAWTRIEFPNGTYMQIGGMPGADSSGYAGFHDLVNDHTWAMFKNALLLSLIDVGMAVASPTSAMTTTGAVTGNTALTDGEQSLAQTFGQAEAQMMQKSMNIAPTITIRPGYAFNVMVTKDLVFPGPYQHGVTEIAQTAPTSAAAPTITNPYN